MDTQTHTAGGTKKFHTPQGKLIQRQALVNEALSHVGAHYLWGGAGNTPGNSDGADYRPLITKMLPDSFDLKHPTIQTAYTRIGGLNTCAGRSDHDLLPVMTHQDILDYLVTGEVRPMSTVTPRVYKFNDKVKQTRRYHYPDGIVWGESCAGIRHFDCIGFVNYCYSKFVSQKKFGTSIEQFMTNSANYGFVEVSDKADVLNGDIIAQHTEAAGWHHIGMVYIEEGSNKYNVVQASDSPVGVIDGKEYHPAHPGAWTKRIRIYDRYL